MKQTNKQKLKEYLANNKISQRSLSLRLREQHDFIYRLITGKKTYTLHEANRIALTIGIDLRLIWVGEIAIYNLSDSYAEPKTYYIGVLEQ